MGTMSWLAQQAIRPGSARDDGASDHAGKHQGGDPRRVIAWVLIVTVPVAAGAILAGLLTLLPVETLQQITTDHFAAVVGLPLAALLAAFVVVALRHTGGPLKFEAFGFKFEGGAGQVILWVICFLAITAAIRVVWNAV